MTHNIQTETEMLRIEWKQSKLIANLVSDWMVIIQLDTDLMEYGEADQITIFLLIPDNVMRCISSLVAGCCVTAKRGVRCVLFTKNMTKDLADMDVRWFVNIILFWFFLMIDVDDYNGVNLPLSYDVDKSLEFSSLFLAEYHSFFVVFQFFRKFIKKYWNVFKPSWSRKKPFLYLLYELLYIQSNESNF